MALHITSKARRVACVLTAGLCLGGPAAAWDDFDVAQMPQQVQVNELPDNVVNFDRRLRRQPILQQRGIYGAPQAMGAAIHTPHEGPITAAAIRTAIDDGVLFLRSRQTPDGAIGRGYVDGGSTGLATLAMLAAGADPVSDPAVKLALEHLLKLETDNTYVVGIRANVWEYALRKAPHEGRYREALQRDVKWLLDARNDEAWRYSSTSTDWDNSCTQYAALGLWAAQRAGIETGDAVWDQLSRHFRREQNKDGGWGYVRGSSSTSNMATAGLATMYLVFDHHYGRKGAWHQGKPAPFASGEAREVLDSIDRGLKWLGGADGDKSNAYYLYGIERTGVAGGRRTLGGADWFAEGADAALRAQREDGAFPLGYSEEIGTALTTLFLVYGGAPPAFAKLQHGADDDWNLNPRDVANLTRRMWSAYERPLNWHTVGIDEPVESFESPILFVSGSKAARFDDAQVATLRDYVERGGMIVAEPADGSPAFRASMVELLGRLFPAKDFPGVTLAPVADDHPIYTVVKHAWKARPKLSAASDGVRTVFVLSEGYLAADWQTDQVESDAFPLAMNLLFHATALRPLEGRFATVPLPEDAAPKRSGEVVVARVKHDEGLDWDVAKHAWDRLRPYAEHATGLSLRARPAVTLGAAAIPDEVDLLHITGRRAMALSPTEQAALQVFVANGGTVLIDAWGGSDDFAASARAMVEQVFSAPYSPPMALAADDPLLTGFFVGGQDV
ncbi:MAG: DUF4159 domain-containing protein, partial [Myxococcales bacterium]|nr:DUF4159 domain-containing protein [Myxococcales bacterium]